MKIIISVRHRNKLISRHHILKNLNKEDILEERTHVCHPVLTHWLHLNLIFFAQWPLVGRIFRPTPLHDFWKMPIYRIFVCRYEDSVTTPPFISSNYYIFPKTIIKDKVCFLWPFLFNWVVDQKSTRKIRYFIRCW